MDFKIAGTQNGITGIQLDLKVTGISEEIIIEENESLMLGNKRRWTFYIHPVAPFFINAFIYVQHFVKSRSVMGQPSPCEDSEADSLSL